MFQNHIRIINDIFAVASSASLTNEIANGYGKGNLLSHVISTNANTIRFCVIEA